ncbi:MAG TPA: aspartate-alanine antiporter [Candidatus Didemnitutus sp.]|nr:aspartate-alanine antiporter [Candidatus Didemnitutus sp.]
MSLLDYVLKAAPEIALFASLALGHALGQVQFGRFSLGGVAGSLIVALVIGQAGVILPGALKALCFALFIYSVGFKSGPEFFGGLNRASLKLVLSSIIHCVVALILIVALAKICDFGPGFAAGVGAGALTQTAMLGTAGDALSRLPLDAEQMVRFNGQMAVGFAITYVFGTVGVIVFVRAVAPRLLGVDVKAAARELEVELSENGKVSRTEYLSPFVPIVSRAYEVTSGQGAKTTVGELEKQFKRASIEKIMRDDELLGHNADTVLKTGDLVGVTGRLEGVVAAGALIGDEVEGKEALSSPIKVANVVIRDRSSVGKTLRQLRSSFNEEVRESVHILSFTRQGLQMPVLLKTEVRRGDVIEIAGRAEEVDRAAAALGVVDPAGEKSDLTFHALAITAGTLLGLLSVNIGGIPVTLGVGGGVLVSGLCFGWWHMRRPIHGALPGPAQWILSEFGLSAFAAATGLSAGPKAVAAIQEQGVALLLAGAVVTIVPLVVALYVGRYLLKLNPVILLGAMAGGQTVAAALNAVTDETESMTPVLGFTVTYAISNVLLAVWGPIIVALT